MNTPLPTAPSCDDSLLWRTWLSYYHLPVLAFADGIGLFAMLHRQPLSATGVAERFNLSPRGAEALLGLLTGLGFLVQKDAHFSITQTTELYLLPSSQFYWGPMLWLARGAVVSYESISKALTEDKPMAYGPGSDIWKVHDESPDQAKLFTAAMHARHWHVAIAAARAGDFEGVTRLLDVGGGSGCFSIAIALAHHIRCTVLELPSISRFTAEYIAKYEAQDLVDTVVANMFTDNWPHGYNAIFMGNILHDWDEGRCRFLLATGYGMLPPGGRIYIHEMLLNETKDGPLNTIGESMVMINFTQGKQFTFSELTALLTQSGFSEITVVPTFGEYSLVSALKV